MSKSRRAKKEESPIVGFRPRPEVYKAMLKLHARDGISMSEQCNRALETFLKKKGL